MAACEQQAWISPARSGQDLRASSPADRRSWTTSQGTLAGRSWWEASAQSHRVGIPATGGSLTIRKDGCLRNDLSLPAPPPPALTLYLSPRPKATEARWVRTWDHPHAVLDLHPFRGQPNDASRHVSISHPTDGPLTHHRTAHAPPGVETATRAPLEPGRHEVQTSLVPAIPTPRSRSPRPGPCSDGRRPEPETPDCFGRNPGPTPNTRSGAPSVFRSLRTAPSIFLSTPAASLPAS
jgi:hypothetical protein